MASSYFFRSTEEGLALVLVGQGCHFHTGRNRPDGLNVSLYGDEICWGFRLLEQVALRPLVLPSSLTLVKAHSLQEQFWRIFGQGLGVK